MSPLNRFAAKHPVWFALAATVAWMVLLAVFMGLASAALHRPYGDDVSGAIARLAITVCVATLAWRLGWIRTSGLGRAGDWRIWFLALGGLVYSTSACLYSFYGKVAIDLSLAVRVPAARTAALTALIVALAEEVLFRGVVLHGLVRAWARTTAGLAASVVMAALLFAAVHGTQVFTNDLSGAAALLLILQTLIISIWWGALVVAGRSVWPAVLLHFAVNAVVAVQGLAGSPAEPALLGYQRHLWLSVPLGLAGMGLLARVARRPALLDEA